MKALLFDMDGVLVDVSESYRQAIMETVRRFSGSGISDRAVQAYKSRGGLNNDWDLTLAVLDDRGVVVDRDEVVAAFQEYYVGRNFDGLIRNEKWLLDLEILKGLSAGYRIGLVTGRPEAETLYTLGRFGARNLFAAVVTMDDLPPGMGKPDPGGIRLALARLASAEGYYVGDTVDDMQAARRAGLVAIGVVRPSDDRSGTEALLISAGASRIVPDINRIKEVLE
jgi:HAD superfamily hydrolase (TIGR01548 family)